MPSGIELKKYIFLLGRHDLEIMEIKSMLKGKAKVIDNNLAWGAKLISYFSQFDIRVYSGFKSKKYYPLLLFLKVN